MELGATKIEAGAVTFALQYRALMPDQGVSSRSQVRWMGSAKNCCVLTALTSGRTIITIRVTRTSGTTWTRRPLESD